MFLGIFFCGCQKWGIIIKGINLYCLCMECLVIIWFSDDWFLKYINEVICWDSDYQCVVNMGFCF